jgi:uncharacterized protein YbjT (DUF2867 family)
MRIRSEQDNNHNLILLVGATGDLGSAVTRILLSQGKSVRILARPNSDYQRLVEAGASLTMGDLKDPASLDAACKDVDVVITTANSAKRKEPDNPFSVDLEGNRHLIDSAKKAKVKQFIFTSLSIADSNNPNPFIQAKAKTEEYLKSSGIPYTIIAPNAFMETWIALVIGLPAVTGQPVTIVGEGKRKHSFVSMFDVAAFMVACINNRNALSQRLAIGGPEPLSLRDAVSVFEKELGRKIVVNSVAPGQPVPGLPPEMAAMLAGLEFFDSPIEMTKLSATYNVKLTSMQTFAHNFVKRQKK